MDDAMPYHGMPDSGMVWLVGYAIWYTTQCAACGSDIDSGVGSGSGGNNGIGIASGSSVDRESAASFDTCRYSSTCFALRHEVIEEPKKILSRRVSMASFVFPSIWD